MNAHVNIAIADAFPVSSRGIFNAQRPVPQQHDDQTFPYVLVTGTLAAIVSVAGVWLTAALIA